MYFRECWGSNDIIAGKIASFYLDIFGVFSHLYNTNLLREHVHW